jgi:hypothetical protein
MTNMMRVTNIKGHSTVDIKEKSNHEMGIKRMGHDRSHNVWKYHIIPLPIHRTSEHGPIQYKSATTTTLLAHHGTIRHIIFSYDGPHMVKKYRVH